MKSLPALFIGRFQPFHLGHLDALRQISKKEKSVIIMIGSAEKSHTLQNPFTAEERCQMIKKALNEANFLKSAKAVIPVRDINSDSRWVKHVESALPPFGKVYTGSRLVKKLFEKDGNHKVLALKMNLKISATEIRKRMRKRKQWEKFVPKAVFDLLGTLPCGLDEKQHLNII